MVGRDRAAVEGGETLAARLSARIVAAGGAITFREWMEAALYDERAGYYARRGRTRWGRAGDYRTSPETSPLFAATFARYFASLHEELGAPREWRIVEAGAGAGDFARVLLETLARDFARVFSATLYFIDERSADARARLRSRLAPYGARIQFRGLDELAGHAGPGVVFSNELLDALPVHRLTARGGETHEMCVGLDEAGAFTWVLRPPSTPRLVAHLESLKLSLAEGQIVEVNLCAEEWIGRAAAALGRGYVVTVDYGAEAEDLYGAPHRRSGTLRSFRDHALTDDPLARPGEQDLTATVDWTTVRRAGERAGLETVSLLRQDEFLLRAGLLAELERMSAASESEADVLALRLGAREMILPGRMGESFQVLVQKKREL